MGVLMQLIGIMISTIEVKKVGSYETQAYKDACMITAQQGNTSR